MNVLGRNIPAAGASQSLSLHPPAIDFINQYYKDEKVPVDDRWRWAWNQNSAGLQVFGLWMPEDNKELALLLKLKFG